MGCNMLVQLVGNVLAVLRTVKGEPQMVRENSAWSSVYPLAVLCMVKWHYSGGQMRVRGHVCCEICGIQLYATTTDITFGTALKCDRYPLCGGLAIPYMVLDGTVGNRCHIWRNRNECNVQPVETFRWKLKDSIWNMKRRVADESNPLLILPLNA